MLGQAKSHYAARQADMNANEDRAVINLQLYQTCRKPICLTL